MKRIVFLLISVVVISANCLAGNIKTTNGVEFFKQDSTYVLKKGFNKADLGDFSTAFNWFASAQKALLSDDITAFTNNGNEYKIKTDEDGKKYITSAKLFNNMRVYQQDIKEIYIEVCQMKAEQAKEKIKSFWK